MAAEPSAVSFWTSDLCRMTRLVLKNNVLRVCRRMVKSPQYEIADFHLMLRNLV